MFPEPEISAWRRLARLALSPMILMGVGGCLAFFWLRSLAIEPFDFDESVYRQMAEEMKRAGGWLSQPLFNGEAYNHKPPFYISVLAAFSALADGSAPQVTSFSSRTVSIFFAVALAWLLHRTWMLLSGVRQATDFEMRRTHEAGIPPAFFLLMSFLPTISSSAILLDPMLVFFTSLYFCCEALRVSRHSEQVGFSWMLFCGSVVGMTGAAMTKGLIGLVLPAGAAVVFLVLQQGSQWRENPRGSFLNVLHSGLRDFFPAWLVAALFSAGFYWLLWSSGGSAFVEEFFIKHHFGRATTAFEGHSGSVFYYVPIVLLGAGFTLSWLAYVYVIGTQKKPESRVENKRTPAVEKSRAVQRWLISWSLFCLVFFSFLATKLPNYIWPIWPALALLASFAGHDSSFSMHKIPQKALHFFAQWSAFILPLALVLLGCAVLLWEPILAAQIQLKPREEAVLASLLQHSSSLSLGLVLSGLLLGFGAILLRSWGELGVQRGKLSPLFSGGVARWLAFSQISACAALMAFVVPVAEDVMTLSVQQSTLKAKMFLGVGEQLATADLYSPNVVSSQGEPVALGIGGSEWIFSDPKFNVILTPVWNVGVCEQRGYDVAQAAEFFRVCLRSYRRTLEGSKP
ncbi:MAG: phospholipid carrier-dependent glycosyltransferase [Betaproteobacteria bacterium]|nr:phospholipid carrier-dependent glycosyltransferase [Betaproteobacteria bacterium]